ncbi:hypothetical protein [Pedobacter sp. CFBP9032]|nr:hypothetical protein [Pedobacter sp. CFBP9032]MDY0904434.1 hypothetical protein [Pedobacter sp. CFBP9032]
MGRTFGSYQAISGASLPIIGKSLGPNQRNARLNVDAVRELINRSHA